MTEQDAFMQAICENPDDDTPRLVFADWLVEHGEEERAEFIRVQCELVKLPTPGAKTIRPLVPTAAYHEGEGICVRCRDDAECRYHALRRREKELLAHCECWLDLVPLLGTGALNGTHKPGAWRRGFIAEITLSCADWLTHREALLKAAPLEKVTLTQLPRLAPQETCTLQRGQPLCLYSADGRLLDLYFPALSGDDLQIERMRAQFLRLHRGLENAGKPVILPLSAFVIPPSF